MFEDQTCDFLKDNANKRQACLCNFISVSAEDFIKHIETKHQTQDVYACDRCDYKGRSEEQFKKHLQTGHNMNTGGFTKVSYTKKNNKQCIYWNRGHCSFQNCKYEHKEIPPCMFNERCDRSDCKYWHAPQTRKFPFLEYRQFSQNAWPRRGGFQQFRN